ncbi:hypothetical protein [Pseudomonas sp. zfem002]|uniref:hypothetical protein n=1 Tax=Pseudomonas sp. zfem002 TaxID=3078197 RepID=UPI0029289AD1|nr:hypothetical protein [Pseudomonas sp. zfem002]MDU9389605.1 hypothetical protein [Pseudomonas sp. zfem002]
MLLASSGCFWTKDPEIAVTIGEPWANTQQRSAVTFTASPESDQIMLASSNARLRLIDLRHGFVTQTGRDIVVFLNKKGRVQTAGLLLGEGPMSLDKAVETAAELQKQMRKRGWAPFLSWAKPPIADTPEWREYLHQSGYSTLSLWQAENSYLATFFLHRIKDSAPGTDGLYVLSLHLDPALKGQ